MPEYFPPRPDLEPKIYAYSDANPHYAGLLKVGYTTRSVQERVAEQYPTKIGGYPDYTIVLTESAMRSDGTTFKDHEVHRHLKAHHVDKEWFRCTKEEVLAAIIAVRERRVNVENRSQTFSMRPEQQAAVDKTAAYFAAIKAESSQPQAQQPKFLWNCKMRFGKTFAAYELARRMKLQRVLVLTFKPAVRNAWQEDLQRHVHFEGWQFISRDSELTFDAADNKRPLVCFGSFQDFMGLNEIGGVKARNEWVHTTHWDLVIFDEYHFGAWKENAKKLFAQEDEDNFDNIDADTYNRADACDESFLPITTDYYLFLSGTPFRALNSGEFIEEQIYNWTYADEQHAKAAWKGAVNPYAALPRMVLMTYQMPEAIRRIAELGEFNEFDLNEFFAATCPQDSNGQGGALEQAVFTHKTEVQQWLSLIRGAYLDKTVDDLKLGSARPPMPYADARLVRVLQHTLWFLPSVAACYAMRNLLRERQNVFYNDYKVIVCAGREAGMGAEAIAPVRRAMLDPLDSKSITLSCGKLTTGVTVRPWTGIFMLRNLSSPETYFQAAFRVQSPWTMQDEYGTEHIIKQECYVFDFALNRALRQVADYSCRLAVNDKSPAQKVEEFIHFLPVIAYDGSSMREINAEEVLDIAMAGTSATLLAKRWESALLVNVDNITLGRLMDNDEAMRALDNIEGFRNLRQDIVHIINTSNAVKKTKKDGEKSEKRHLTEQEKELKSRRKKIQDTLIKLATRVPIFMYLTDFREQCLKDVITQLEPDLFKKVTGLSLKDFELLTSLGVFNDTLMNDAVYKFKRYEDASLSYTGIDRHEGEKVGGYNTVVSATEFRHMGGDTLGR